MLRLAETACKVASDADAVVVSRDDNWGAQGVKIMGLPMGRRHWCVAVDGLEYKLSSLVIASTELRKLGVHASPSRYSAEVLYRLLLTQRALAASVRDSSIDLLWVGNWGSVIGPDQGGALIASCRRLPRSSTTIQSSAGEPGCRALGLDMAAVQLHGHDCSPLPVH